MGPTKKTKVMSNSVKSKFAGLLRGLLRRVDREEAPVAPEPHPVTATAPEEPASAAVESSAPPALVKIASVPPNENEIAVPLAPIMASLPMDMRAKVVSVPPPGMTINLSVENVVSQLAFGAVRITFGELRQMTQGVFSNFTGDLDSKSINLPLNEILSRINPALLSRRSGSKVEVTDEISGPFGAGGSGVAFTSQPIKAPTPTPPTPTRVPIATNLPPRGNSPVIPPAEAPAMPPSAPIAFRPPPGAGRFVQPTPLGGSAPATNGQNGHHGTNGNGNHNGNGHDNNIAKTNGTNGANGSNGHHAPPPPTPPPVVPPTPKISAAPAPVPTPAPVASVAPRPEPAQPTIYAAVWDLAENWPQPVKDEISHSALANVNVPLSGSIVAAGLKRGRIVMTWKEIRSLAKPSSMPSPNDALELELPLKLIAPLFFAAQKNLPSARKATSVSSEIPNLFFGFPQASAAPVPHTPPSAPPATPVAPVVSVPPLAPPPTAAPLKAFVPIVPPASPLEKKEANSNFYVWGENGEIPKLESEYSLPTVPNTDFTSRRATPKEVVARAIALRGVAGAVVTLPDGLRVASEVPAEFNADTLAAFIPQIFERMNQSARELRMGSLNNVSFTVGNVPWRIIRVNAVYLAAFGRAGVSLPAAELTELAEELDRKKS